MAPHGAKLRMEHDVVTWEARSVMTPTAVVFTTVLRKKKKEGPTYVSKNAYQGNNFLRIQQFR